jgi:O-antigen/teichoic acid export membrane protein
MGFMLQKCGQLLLLPLFIAKLSAEDFARYGLMQSVIQLAPPILTLRLHTSIGRLIFDTTEYSRSPLLSSCLIGSVIPIVLFTSALSVGTYWNVVHDPVTLGTPFLAVLLGIILLSRVVVEFASILFRAEGRGPQFLLVTVLDGLSFALLAAFALTRENTGYNSLVQYVAIAGAGTTICCLLLLRKQIDTWTLESRIILDSLSYSWPTAIHLVGMWFSLQTARWIGVAKLGLSAMASFTLIMLLVSVASIVTRTVFETERPTIGKLFAQADYVKGESVLARCRFRSVVVAISLCLLIGVAYWIMDELVPVEYQIDAPMYLFISLFVIIDAVSLKSTNMLLALKKSRGMIVGSVAGGVVALLASGPLCNAYGLIGLCCSLSISGCFQAVVTEWIARRTFKDMVMQAS